MSVPEAVFSATERVAGLLAKVGASLTFDTLIVTSMLSVKLPVEAAVTVTE